MSVLVYDCIQKGLIRVQEGKSNSGYEKIILQLKGIFFKANSCPGALLALVLFAHDVWSPVNLLTWSKVH